MGMGKNYRCVVIRSRFQDTTYSTCHGADTCPARRLAQRGVILARIYSRSDTF